MPWTKVAGSWSLEEMREEMDKNRLTSPRLRVAFLVAAGLFLVIGLYLFVFAESTATLPASARGGNAWPWAIGPLALRFIAAIFLSGALASFFVSQRLDRPTVAAFSTVAAVASAMFLVHLVINLGSINWAKPLAFVWLVVLIGGLIGSVMLTLRMRRDAVFSAPPLPATPSIARYIALFIFVLTGLVGGAMFFFPDFGRERWPWDLVNSTNVQLLGALFITVSISALVSWLQPSWYGYDLFFPGAGTFVVIALIASFIHWELFAAKPLTSGLFVAIYLLGGVMGFYPYFRYGIGQKRSVGR